MKSFDPDQLDNRWQQSPAGSRLLHPSLQLNGFDGNLAQLALSLTESIQQEAQGLAMRERLGDERLKIVMALIESLKVAVERESNAWKLRTLEEKRKTEESLGNESTPSVDRVEVEEPVLDVDEFERVAADLDGLLELYLQDS